MGGVLCQTFSVLQGCSEYRWVLVVLMLVVADDDHDKDYDDFDDNVHDDD